MKKCKAACENFGIRNKIYNNSTEINKEFGYFAFPQEKQNEENYQALFEYEAGYLKAEDCVRIHLQLAERNGAKALFGCKVNRIVFSEELECYVLSEENQKENNNNFVVDNVCGENDYCDKNYENYKDSVCGNKNKNGIKYNLNESIFYAKKIVLSCGSWINEILSANFNFKLPLTIDLNHVYYFKFLNNSILRNINNENLSTECNYENSNLKNTPIFIIQEDEENELYGFPDINNGNFFKFSLYHQKLSHNSVSEVKREHNSQIFSKVKKLCGKFIKNFREENVELVKEISCLYTSTPDRDFVIDYLPNTDMKVVVCSACSGHGFKFSSAVGEHIKKLLYGECLPYEQFKIERFGDSFLK